MPFCQVCNRELEGIEFRTICDRAVCSLSCVGLLTATKNDKCHECLRPVWKDNYYIIENDFFCSFNCKEKTRKKLLKERSHLTVKHCQDERYYNITPQKEIKELRKEALEIFNELENSHVSPRKNLNTSCPLQEIIEISNSKEVEKKSSPKNIKKTGIISIPKPNIISKKTKNVVFKRKIAKPTIYKNMSTGNLHSNSSHKNKYILTVFSNNIKNNSKILNKINIKISPTKKAVSSEHKHNFKKMNIGSCKNNNASSKRYCTTNLVNYNNNNNNNQIYRNNNDHDYYYFDRKLNTNINESSIYGKILTNDNINKINPDYGYINGSFISHNNSQYNDFDNNYFFENEPDQNRKGLNSIGEKFEKNNIFMNKKKNVYFSHIHKSRSLSSFNNNKENYAKNNRYYYDYNKFNKYDNSSIQN